MRSQICRVLENNSLRISFTRSLGFDTILASWLGFVTLDSPLSTG